jgi:hypothetical protein
MKKTSAAKILSAMALVFLTGCATPISDLPKDQRDAITMRIYYKDYDSVFKAVMAGFADQGMPPVNADKASGFIVSSPKGIHAGQQFMRMSAIVKKIDDKSTKVTLAATVQRVTATNTGLGLANGTVTAKAKPTFDKFFTSIEENLK